MIYGNGGRPFDRCDDYDPLRSSIGVGPQGDGIDVRVVEDDPYGYYRLQFLNSNTGEVLTTTPNLDPGSRFFVCTANLQTTSMSTREFTAGSGTFTTMQALTIQDARVGDLVIYDVSRLMSDDADRYHDFLGFGVITSIDNDPDAGMLITFNEVMEFDTTMNIENLSIPTSKLENGAVTSEKLANGSVGWVKLADGAVHTDKLADGAVTTAKMADNTVTSEKVAPNAITYADISVTGSDRIHEENINDNAASTRVIADDSVTDAKLVNDGIKKTFPETLAYFIDGEIVELETGISSSYVNSIGNVVSSVNHMITNSFELNAGDKVRVYAKGYNTNVAILARVNDETANHPYTPVIVDDNSGAHWYEFTIAISGTHVISCSLSVEPKIIVCPYSPSIITEQINYITDQIGHNVDITMNIGSYVNNLGNISTNNSYFISNEFDLVKGDVVNFYIKGYLTNVGLLSKVNNAAASYPYTVIVRSENSDPGWHEVTINQSGKYVLSGGKNVNPSLSVITIHRSAVIPYSDFSVFRKFGVIGDSYASGELYFGGHYVDEYSRSWGQVLARMCGNTCTNYSKGGLTTKTWLTSNRGLSLVNSNDPEDLYILALGINDYAQGAAYLGTIEDITSHTSYSDYADSFYGNYGKIIEQVMAHAPHAKLIILTCAATHENAMMYNDAIEEIAAHYGLPCIKQYEDQFFQSYTYTNMSGGHPRAVAYSGMATTFKRLIEDAMISYSSYFDDLYMYTE